MHELLASLVWAVELDAIDPSSMYKGASHPDHRLVATVYDATYIENDSFALFESLMRSMKTAYAARTSGGPIDAYSTPIDSEPEIVARSRKILQDYIAVVDPELASHLIALDIPPQLFLMYAISPPPNL